MLPVFLLEIKLAGDFSAGIGAERIFQRGIQNTSYKALHAGGAVLLHPLGEVAVPVQRERRRGVPKVALHRFDIIPGPDSVHGIAVRVQVPGEPFQKLPGGFSAAPRLVLKQDN